MAKKRKSDATRLDEVDRNVYSTFCSAASSLSQLYTHSMHQQRLSLQAGERHGLEKLYNWILRQQQDGLRVATRDILSYIQNEMDYVADEPSLSPRQTLQHQQLSHNADSSHPSHTGYPMHSNSFSNTAIGQGLRSLTSDHNKNAFPNTLPSPARRYLMQQTTGGSFTHVTQDNMETLNQTRYQNPPTPCSDDTSMEMHAESP